MNDPFRDFVLDPYGMDSFAPQQVPQQSQHQQQQPQQQQHAYLGNNGLSANGPCLDNYDPNQVLMPNSIVTSPYNIGQQQQQRSNNHSTMKQNGLGRNNLGHHVNHQPHATQHGTHQMLMPGTNLNAQHPSRRTSSSSQNSSHMQQQQQQLHQQVGLQQLQTGFSDFDPTPMQHQLQSTSRSSMNSSNSMSVGGHGGSIQLSYQKQQQQQQQQHRQSYHSASDRSGRTTEKASVTSYYSVQSSSQQSQQQNSRYAQRQQQQKRLKPEIIPSKPKKEEWLEKLQVKVSGVSLEPMTGTQIVELLRKRTNEVLTRYLPCVDFLVQCQQELRKGLQIATSKRYGSHGFRDALTPRQFHSQYILNLPSRFYKKNIGIMSKENLTVAYKEIEKLVANAKAVENQGCEVVKNTFLGGMKDGESWGLRKWLSKQGGALHICNDTECLSTSCQKLEREAESTCKLAARLRPLADTALKKLKSEIPASYQEQSSAHPYLPFFHRLECALRGMANFDPEDDDVICIMDDDEVEELKAKASSAPPPSKRKRSRNKMSGGSSDSKPAKRKANEPKFTSTFNDDDDSDIEVLERQPTPKRAKKADTTGDALDFGLEGITGDAVDESDIMQDLLKTLDDEDKNAFDFDAFDKKNELNGINGTSNVNKYGAFDLADGLECIACLFDNNKQYTVRPIEVEKEPFWDSRYQYASVLRLFCDILRNPDCTEAYLEMADEEELIQEGKLPYSEIVRHPLCFRDIASALFQDYSMLENDIRCSNGMLPLETTLQDWNMWKGKDLLQAIDLVFLNSLAYGKANDGPERTSMRSRTNKLRKLLWAGIKDVIDDNLLSSDPEERRRCTPTRRGESSGFVVKKGSS